MKQPTPRDLLQIGYSFIPVTPDKKPRLDLLPRNDEDKPTWAPFMRRPPTEEELHRWLKATPKVEAWAIVCGAVSRVFVTDFDIPNGPSLLEQFGLKPHLQSGSGGYHIHWRHPGGIVPIREKGWMSRQGFDGIEIKGDGSLCHVIGRNMKGAYTWLRPITEIEPVSAFPAALRKFLEPDAPRPRVEHKVINLDGRADWDYLLNKYIAKAKTPRGRNRSGYDLAQQLHDARYTPSEIEHIVCDLYAAAVPPVNTQGEPEPYTREEALRSVQSALRNPPREPITKSSKATQGAPKMAAPAAAPAAAAAAAAAAPVTIDWQAPEPRGLKRFPLTDCGNAERLVHRHGAAMRFVHEWKEWIVWQKAGYWRLDNYEVKRRAKETVRTIAVDAAKLRKEAAATSDEAEKAKKEAAAKALTRHATECEAKSRLAAMCDLAQSEYGVTIEAASLDRHRFKLNFANGTLSLKTFELRPHNPHDLITKMVCRRDPDDPTKIEPIKYDPNAKAPTWEAFLHRIFDGNARLISYVQRAAGYSMTGSSREKCLFLLWGQVGNNGKTTFLEVLRAVLADYAGQVKIETLMDSDRPTSGDAPSADMADLKGTRFVTASEPKKNQKFHEGKLKYLTGMGEIKARRPHDRHTVSFQQTWKFWIECNNRPVIIGSDDALWSRFHLIPFTVHIPAAERDADLREKLMAELEGIIAWCVEGARAWQEHGLQPPPEVTAATEEYRAEMDIPGRFFDECTAAAPGMHIRARALYHAFKTWCAEVNEYPCKEREFGQRCTARGLERVHRNIGEVYLNIRMIRTFDPPSTTETDTVSENTKGEGMRDSEGTSHKLSHAPARPKFSNFTEKGSPSLTPHLSLDGSQTDTEEL